MATDTAPPTVCDQSSNKAALKAGETALITITLSEPAMEFQCWGKLRRHPDTENAVAVHPLLDHLADVACCFAELAQCPSIKRALTHTAGRPLEELDFQRLSVIALLHDLGKANAGFQCKFWKSESAAPAGWPLQVRSDVSAGVNPTLFAGEVAVL
jgi:hypothetical protein